MTDAIRCPVVIDGEQCRWSIHTGNVHNFTDHPNYLLRPSGHGSGYERWVVGGLVTTTCLAVVAILVFAIVALVGGACV